MTTSIKQIIEDLKLQSGALPPLEIINRTESALIRGLISNDLWDESDYRHNPKERMRAASAIRNFIRHNAIISMLDVILDAHLKNPTVPTIELLSSLVYTVTENEQEEINTPISHLCAYLIHRIDQLEALAKRPAQSSNSKQKD